MNIYQSEATCDLCGDTGCCTPQTSAAAWRVGTTIYCTDIASCAARVKRNKQKLEERIKELESQKQTA